MNPSSVANGDHEARAKPPHARRSPAKGGGFDSDSPDWSDAFMPKLILYNYFRSSTSYRVRIALHLKNLEYEYRPVHLLKAEQHSAEYRALNPVGGVPTLVHDGRAIAQSLAILEYLDDVFGGPKLYPADPYERARVRQFCETVNSDMHPLGNLKVLQELEKRHGYDQAAKEKWIGHWMGLGFAALEKILGETAGDFCFGNSVTAADLCLIPMMFSARRFNVDLGPFPIARRIDERATKIPAFEKAHPMRQPDTPQA